MKLIVIQSIRVIFIILSIFVFHSCQNKEGEDKKVTEIRTQGPISDIVRNPVTADGNEDTINVAKITFEKTLYDFGTVKVGAIVEQEFRFTNTGKIPLLINDCRSTCGCTVPEWPKHAIMPGEGGTITVRFNTEGRKYDQDRPVTVIANTFPKNTIVRLRGHVELN
jgi:hypothetical protein